MSSSLVQRVAEREHEREIIMRQDVLKLQCLHGLIDYCFVISASLEQEEDEDDTCQRLGKISSLTNEHVENNDR